MSAWTTLAMAKKHVGIPLTECSNDDLLQAFLARAEARVLNFVTNNGATAAPVPPDDDLSGGIYEMFAYLWRYRGDDVDGDAPNPRIPGSLPPQVEQCVLKYRLPSIA